MATKRQDIELRLKVVADTTGAKAGMDQLAQAAERAQRASSKAQQVAAAPPSFIQGQNGAMFPNTPAGLAAARASNGRVNETVAALRMAGLGKGAGGTAAAPAAGGGIGGVATAIAARFGIPTAVAGPAASAASVYQAAAMWKTGENAAADPDNTYGLRNRAITSSMIGGSTLQGFADTASGRSAGMLAAVRDGRFQAAEAQAGTALFGTRLDLNAQQVGARATADSFRGARAEAMPGGFDRTSAGGEREYRIEAQRLQLRERAADADRRAAAASVERTKAEERLAVLNRRGDWFDNRRRQIAGELSELDQRAARPTPLFSRERFFGRDDLSGPDRLRLLNEDRIRLDQRAGVDQQTTAERQRLAEIERRRVQAEADRDRANGPERLRLEASVLEDRAGRAMGAAERLGGATQEGAEEGYLALMNVVQGGVENADPTEIAAAQRFAPETVQRLVRQAGRRNPMFDAFRDLAPDDFPAEDANDLFRRAGGLNQQARQGELDVQGRVAAASADIVDAMSRAIVDTLTAAIPRIREQLLRELQIGKQQGSGSN